MRDETILFAGTAVEILVAGEQTANRLALLRIANPPGTWTPPHRHLHEEETIYVLSGQLRIETEDGSRALSAGEVAVLPRGRAHRLGNDGPEEVQALVLCTPSGFERFVREAGEPVAEPGPARPPGAEALARLGSLAPHFGIELLPGISEPLPPE